jgi:hypothetical protein
MYSFEYLQNKIYTNDYNTQLFLNETLNHLKQTWKQIKLAISSYYQQAINPVTQNSSNFHIKL